MTEAEEVREEPVEEKKDAEEKEEEGITLPALTDEEKEHLRHVLERAESIQRQDESRKEQLKCSSNVNLAVPEAEEGSEDSRAHVCVFCGAGLRWLLNPGTECDVCGRAACRKCIRALRGDQRHLCPVCVADLRFRMQSGDWFRAESGAEDSEEAAERAKQLVIEELREALTRARPPAPAEKTEEEAEDIIQRRDSIRSQPRSSLVEPPAAVDEDPAELQLDSLPAITVESDRSPASSRRSSMGGSARHRILRKKSHDVSRSSSVSTDVNSCLDSRASLSISQQSLVSLYSLADDNFDLPDGAIASGEVQLGLQFDRKKNYLRVAVLQCRNLLAYVKEKRSSDPFVKVYLLPDKTRAAKRKTSHRKGTLSPVFNETFKYRVEPDDLETRSVWLTVWHHSRLGHNAFLGEALVPLIDVRLDDPAPQWYPLHEKQEIDLASPHLIYKGDLSVAVKHVPLEGTRKGFRFKKEKSRGELHVWIKDAKNLIPTHSNGFSNPFAKVLLLPDRSKKGKRKTEVIHKTLSPSWNTVLRFENVAAVELEERSLEITVWDRSRLRANEFLGGVRLNLGLGEHAGRPVKWMNADGAEVELWETVIQQPKQWAEGSLTLRAHMD